MSNSQKFVIPTLAWFGQKDLKLEFPANWKVSFLPMKGYYAKRVSNDDIKRALREPLGTKPLRLIARARNEVAILIDDMTRVTRAYQVIPSVLEELRAAGISDDHIRFIMGSGLHAASYRDDFAKKIGEQNVQSYPVYNHNPFGNCEKVGETSRSTPVEVNAEYASCDLKIGIGSVVPHPDAGFGGGAKVILPGISSFDSVCHMHKLQGTLQADSSNWGRLAGNVIRNDIDEAGEISRMDMKIDVLVNGVGDSIKVFAGKLKEEFMEACAHGRECYSTPKLPEVVDVIVANTYAKACQASLAVSNWKHSLKSNGIMVVIAQAPEGQGTHYLQGKFGKRQYAPGYEAEKVDFRKLIVFSEYKTPDPLLPIAETDVVWRSNWQDVVEDIRECFQDKPKVALLPNSDIQCDAKTLNVS